MLSTNRYKEYSSQASEIVGWVLDSLYLHILVILTVVITLELALQVNEL